MKKDFRLDLEKLDNKCLLSSNPWFVDTVKAPDVWSQIVDLSNKPVVEIYINNRLRYRVVADQYLYYSGRSDGFAVSINRKFLKYGWNLVEIRIKDPMNQLVSVVIKKNVRR